MCKHVLNAQVSIRAPCCKKWFDCPMCHLESSPGHEIKYDTIVVFDRIRERESFRDGLHTVTHLGGTVHSFFEHLHGALAQTIEYRHALQRRKARWST